MAFDTELADRIRDLLDEEPVVWERKMFGGITFMVDGNMAVGVMGDGVIVRVGEVAFEDAIERPGATVFDLTGRMKGWVVVGPEGLADSDEFANWVGRGVAYAKSLPPKPNPKPAN